MKNFLKKAIVPISAIVLALIMIASYFLFVAPKATEGEKSITVEIVYAENNFTYTVETDAETVYEVLVELDTVYEIKLVTTDSVYGKYVSSLKGVSENDELGYYYTYSIKGIDFAGGISTQTIKNGDVITFKYSKDSYDENFNLISSELQGKGETSSYVKLGLVFALISAVLIALAITYTIVKIVKKSNKNEQ
jgi:hypothetical protein